MQSPKIPTVYFESYGPLSLPRPDLLSPQGWSLELVAAACARMRSHALAPSSDRLAFIWDRGDLSDVYMMGTEGGWPGRISHERPPVPYWDDGAPCWSPDSAWLAFTMLDHVYITPASGALPTQVTDFVTSASAPVWMPDSQSLIVTIDRYDANQLALIDRAGSWIRSLTNHAEGDALDADPAPDGKSIAYTYRPLDDLNRQDVRLINLENGQIRTVFGAPQEVCSEPRWSPDGRRLAFLSHRSGYYELWLYDPANDQAHQLTRLGQDLDNPAWSPDGSRLACSANRGGHFELLLVDAHNGAASTLHAGPGIHAHPQWSADGGFITYEYESPIEPPDLYKIDVETHAITRLTDIRLPAFHSLELVMPEAVSYKSQDGLEIPVFLLRPRQSNGAAIVCPHGGPKDQWIADYDIFVQYLVANGYTILAPNYRGSTGYGREYERLNYDDWGGMDVQDCLYGAHYLKERFSFDAERTAIMGSSAGGYLANCCMAVPPPGSFACGISLYGDANILTSWAQCSRRLRLYSEIFLGNPAQNRDVYRRGSPVYQVQNVQRPILLLHGLLDDVVPPEASDEWAEALRKAGKTYEYKAYPDEGHGFLRRANRLDAWERIERFLDWYLLPMGINS